DLIRGRALVGLSRYYLLLPKADAKPGLSLARKALNLYTKQRYPWGRAHSLRHIALHEHYQDQNADAITHFRKALTLFSSIGDERGLAQTYECMTYVAPENSQGNVTAADRLEWALMASRLYRRVGNRRGIADGQRTMTTIAMHTGVEPTT